MEGADRNAYQRIVLDDHTRGRRAQRECHYQQRSEVRKRRTALLSAQFVNLDR